MDFSSKDPGMWILHLSGISTDDLRGKSDPERYLKSTGKRAVGSLQQMATCAGRKKMVFSFSPACMSAPSCLLLSFSREGFIYHACCQCFSFVFNIRKTDLAMFSTNVLSAVSITLRKQKVFRIALCYYRYLPFSSLLAPSLYFFLFSDAFHPLLIITATLFD